MVKRPSTCTLIGAALLGRAGRDGQQHRRALFDVDGLLQGHNFAVGGCGQRSIADRERGEHGDLHLRRRRAGDRELIDHHAGAKAHGGFALQPVRAHADDIQGHGLQLRNHRNAVPAAAAIRRSRQ